MPACRKCSRPVAGAGAVPLWDGQVYCADCVEAACPGLADYARAHDCLEDVISSGVHPRPTLLFHAAAAVAGFACLGSMSFTKLGNMFLAGAATMSLFAASAVLVVFWLLLLAAGPADGGVGRAVRVRGGVVEIATGRRVRRVPLARCRWRAGLSRADFALRHFDPCPAILLTVGELGPVACGLTDDGYDRWAGFLALAGVRPAYRPVERLHPGRLFAWLPLAAVVGTASVVGVTARLEAAGWVAPVGLPGYVFSVIFCWLVCGLGLGLQFACGTLWEHYPGWRWAAAVASGPAAAALLWGLLPGFGGWDHLLALVVANTVAAGLLLATARLWDRRWPHPIPEPDPRRPIDGYWPGYDDEE